MNLGNPDEFTIKELAEKVIDLTGSSSQIIFKPLPHDDPMQRQPDITLAKRELGLEPTIKLEMGLTTTITYFDDYLKAFGVKAEGIEPIEINWAVLNQKRKVG